LIQYSPRWSKNLHTARAHVHDDQRAYHDEDYNHGTHEWALGCYLRATTTRVVLEAEIPAESNYQSIFLELQWLEFIDHKCSSYNVTMGCQYHYHPKKIPPHLFNFGGLIKSHFLE